MQKINEKTTKKAPFFASLSARGGLVRRSFNESGLLGLTILRSFMAAIVAHLSALIFVSFRPKSV